MEAVAGLMVLLLGVCHGVETSCDGRQDGAQCYGALGGTVDVQLMDDASEIFNYIWKKNKREILSVRKNIILTNLLEKRSSFTPSNGTFRFNNLSRNDDDGEYFLLIYDSNGRVSEERSLNLSIQAPVSSVLLLSQCLSEGQMRASCSSEGGDSPQYSWTLDGRMLTEAELLSGDAETDSIILKQHVSGRLLCSVRNHISRVSEEKEISTCGFIFINCTSNGTHISQWVFAATNKLCVEPTTHPTTVTHTTVGKETEINLSSSVKPSSNITSSNQTLAPSPWYRSPTNLHIMAGVLSTLLLLLVIGVAVACAQKKKKSTIRKDEDHEQDLTYADVRIMKRPGTRHTPPMEEAAVEYGQVRFSARPQPSATAAAGDECVYAKVRRDR